MGEKEFLIAVEEGRLMATQVICKCGNLFPAARARLGYTTCLPCGDRDAKKVSFAVMPAYSKGAYQVISRDDIANTNPKR